jgi:RNA polymerase sigma-70 factor (ECF subfamily)
VGWAPEASSDDALVAGIGDRDQLALAEVYRRYGGAVWAVASQVCGSESLASQVCEAVFTDLWARPRRFSPSQGSLRSWLVAQAHARAVAAARSEDDGAPGPTPPSAEVEGTEHAATLSGAARRAVDGLATAERDAILLVYLGGHSCRETARLLGTSEDVVKSHIRHGLVHLRQALDAQEVTR